MNREQKAVVIDEIAAQIEGSQAIFAVDYRGITVAQLAVLRAKLREADASFTVVKNSLTERAADQVGAEELKQLLSGPTALTFVRGDAAMAAKALSDEARATQLLAFKGGVMGSAALTAEQVSSIARLPSRDVLYGQLVGIVASPISGLVRTLNALIGGIAIQLGGVLEKKQSGEIPSGEAPAVEPASEQAAAPEAEAPQEDSAAEAAATEQVATAEAEAAEEAGAAEAEAVEESSAVETEAVEQAAAAEVEATEEAATPEAEVAEEVAAPEAEAAEPAADEAEPQADAAAEHDNQADASADPAAEEEAK